MRLVSPFVFLMTLPFWALAQGTGVRCCCNKNDKGICSESTCILLKDSNCCHYKTPYTRFEDGKQYKLLNPCEYILLYKQEMRTNKWTQYEYYFSKDLDSPLIKLTKENLKKIYTDNTEFREKLDMVFRNDSELARYDELYNMYLVNWLYNRVTQ